jgi:hypothetical protein
MSKLNETVVMIIFHSECVVHTRFKSIANSGLFQEGTCTKIIVKMPPGATVYTCTSVMGTHYDLVVGRTNE